ncbi:MAG: hypothetical protein ACTS44_01100 [Candidatus Hodgkinia cicadicola]
MVIPSFCWYDWSWWTVLVKCITSAANEAETYKLVWTDLATFLRSSDVELFSQVRDDKVIINSSVRVESRVHVKIYRSSWFSSNYRIDWL